MKILLSSNGWRDNGKIGNQFLNLIEKDVSSIKALVVTTATEESEDWKHVELVLKDFEKIEITKKW